MTTPEGAANEAFERIFSELKERMDDVTIGAWKAGFIRGYQEKESELHAIEKAAFEAAREPDHYDVCFGTPGRIGVGKKYPRFNDYKQREGKKSK